jgi:putative transposase
VSPQTVTIQAERLGSRVVLDAAGGTRGVYPEVPTQDVVSDVAPHGEVFRNLAAQKESRIEEGHLLPDHVHMMIAIPPKYAVSQAVGFIKGKSAIHLASVYGEHRRNFVGEHF